MIRPVSSLCLTLVLCSCAARLAAAQLNVLAIGIKDYPHYPDAPLKYADLDAVGFASLFEGPEASGASVKTLLNRPASREAILDALADLQTEAPPDTLFVFFSGHAETDSRTSHQIYLMPYWSDKSHLAATGLAWPEFEKEILAVGAKHTVIFLDACHGGAALDSKGTVVNPPTAGRLAEQLSARNRDIGRTYIVFSSATSNEVSSEDEEYHQGIFTHFVLEGLRGAAAPDRRDGRVTAGDLKEYLEREIPKRVRVLGKPVQTPIVSAGFDSRLTLILKAAPVDSLSGAAPTEFFPPSSEGTTMEKDPELKLMVRLLMARINGNAASSQDMYVGPVLEALNAYRWLKSENTHRISQLDTSVCSTLSPDGSTLVSVLEPAALAVVDVQTGNRRATLPVAIPSNSASDTHLDSCSISISGDGHYAAVAMRSVMGRSKSVVIVLGSDRVPDLNDSDYAAVSFGAGFLAMGRNATLRIIKTATWTEAFSVPLSGVGSIRRFLSEPNSNILGVLDDRGRTEVFRIDLNGNAPVPVSGITASTCNAALDSMVCEKEGMLVALASEAGGVFPSQCPPGGCRIFPAATTVRDSPWFTMFQGLTEPNVLRLGSKSDLERYGQFKVIHVTLDEPVLTARVLADDTVVAVSRSGATYRFSTLAFVDCCSVSREPMQQQVHVAAGSSGVTVVLTADGASGRLKILKGTRQLQTIAAGNVEWVKQLYLTGSNRFLALAGDDKIRLFELDSAMRPVSAFRDIACGLPFAVDPIRLKIACVGPGGDNPRTYSLSTGSLEQEFVGHYGPYRPFPQIKASSAPLEFTQAGLQP